MERKYLRGLEDSLAQNPHRNALKRPSNPSLRTEDKKLRGRKNRPGKTGKTTSGHKVEAEELGMIANWSHEFGYVSLHDPTTGEWHDLQTKDAPGWSLTEARKRKELYRDGNHRAYRLASREMEEIWESEQPQDEGIVEELALPED
jgi:hypothetical protein